MTDMAPALDTPEPALADTLVTAPPVSETPLSETPPSQAPLISVPIQRSSTDMRAPAREPDTAEPRHGPEPLPQNDAAILPDHAPAPLPPCTAAVLPDHAPAPLPPRTAAVLPDHAPAPPPPRTAAVLPDHAPASPPPRTAAVLPEAPATPAMPPGSEPPPPTATLHDRPPLPPPPHRPGNLVAEPPNDPAADERRARLVLHHAADAGDPLICRMVRRFGAALVAEALVAGNGPDLYGAHEASADLNSLISRSSTLQVRCSRADPDADLAAAAAVGARYLVPADEGWPEQVADLGDTAPLGLWVVGPAELSARRVRSVAVVGARNATGYGMHIAGELAVGVAERGWTVVSGAARGIDGAAHRGALAARGPTVAVLACGVDLVYPLGHEALLSAIATEGAVVSELPPGTTVSRYRFLDRNRLIAGLAHGTVVVEAAARSGSLVTARLADEIGRPVLAVPGPVTSEASQGTHQLIRDGALLVTRAAEIVEHLGDFGSDLAEPESRFGSGTEPGTNGAAAPPAKRPHDDLDPLAARLLDVLPLAGKGALDTPEAALAAGVDSRTALAALGRLSIRGLVDRAEHGWFARRMPR